MNMLFAATSLKPTVVRKRRRNREGGREGGREDEWP